MSSSRSRQRSQLNLAELETKLDELIELLMGANDANPVNGPETSARARESASELGGLEARAAEEYKEVWMRTFSARHPDHRDEVSNWFDAERAEFPEHYQRGVEACLVHARRNGHEVTAQALATIAGKSTFDQASSAMHPGENAAKSEGNLDGGFIAKSRNWILGSGLASAGTGLALIAANVINPLSWGAAALVGGGVGAVLVARKVKQMVTQSREKQTQAVLDRHGPMSHESAKEIVNLVVVGASLVR